MPTNRPLAPPNFINTAAADYRPGLGRAAAAAGAGAGVLLGLR